MSTSPIVPPPAPPTAEPDGDGSRLPDPRDRNLSTRDRTLVAGLHALLHEPDTVLADGLHRKRLAATAGQSRQTLYQHFPEHGAYLEEMFALLLDPHSDYWPTRDLVEYTRATVRRTPTDSLAIVEQLARADFDDLRTDEHWQLVVTAWALGRHRPDVAQGLRTTWAYYNRRTAEALDELLVHWDATLAPPFDSISAAHVFGALGEGLAMRSAVLEEVDVDLFATTVAAIAHAIVVPRGSERRFEAELPQPDEPAPRPLDAFDAERVVTAALDHFVVHGLAPSFAMLSTATGMAASSIRAHFTDLDGITASAWNRLYAETDRRFLALDPGLPACERLSMHLTHVADVAATCPGLTIAFMILLTRATAGDLPPLARGAVRRPTTSIEELLREARRNGEMAYTMTPTLAAQHLMGTLLGQAALAPRPHGDRKPDVDAIVATIWALCIEGWCALPLADDGAEQPVDATI
jgi:AcrR family transcriptional regulator